MAQGLSDPSYIDATAMKTEEKWRGPTRMGPPARQIFAAWGLKVFAEVALRGGGAAAQEELKKFSRR